MKLAYLEYKDLPNRPEDKENSISLILETSDEVMRYFELTANHNTRKIMGAWDSMSENVKRGFEAGSHLPYDPIYKLAGLMATTRMDKRPYSLIELARDYDVINQQKMATMLNIISREGQVRVNAMGGYSSMDAFNITEKIPADEAKIHQYLISGNINENGLPTVEIKHDTLVIENDIRLSQRMWKYLENIKVKSPAYRKFDKFTEFKSKTEFLKLDQMYTLFESFISQGTRHIIAETTMIDKMQIHILKKVLQKVMDKFPEITLKVTLLLNDEPDKDLLKTDRKNLKLKIVIP